MFKRHLDFNTPLQLGFSLILEGDDRQATALKLSLLPLMQVEPDQ